MPLRLSLAGATPTSFSLNNLLNKFDEDLHLHALIGSYLAATGLLLLTFPRFSVSGLVEDILGWMHNGVVLVMSYLLLRGAYYTVKAPRARPFRWIFAHVRDAFTPKLAAGFALYCSLGFFLAAFSTTKNILPTIQPFYFDSALARANKVLFFGNSAWGLLQGGLGHHWITRTIEFFYHGVWSILAVLVPFYMAVFCEDRALRRQYLLAFLLAWIVLGTIMAGLFMSAGPAFYGHVTGDFTRFRAMADYLSFDRDMPFSASSIQTYLWNEHRAGRIDFGTGISDLPSLHITMSFLWTGLAWRTDRRLGWIAVAFTLLIVVGSVHLGWHYASGSILAVATAWGLWKVCGRLGRRHRGWQVAMLDLHAIEEGGLQPALAASPG